MLKNHRFNVSAYFRGGTVYFVGKARLNKLFNIYEAICSLLGREVGLGLRLKPFNLYWALKSKYKYKLNNCFFMF